jgi:hypothetical protein
MSNNLHVIIGKGSDENLEDIMRYYQYRSARNYSGYTDGLININYIE